MLKRLAVLAFVSAATFAAAGGDEIKWTKSKELAFAPPGTPVTNYKSGVSEISRKYQLTWSPYTNNDIEKVLVVYHGWDTFAAQINYSLKGGGLTQGESATIIAKESEIQTEYITITVTVIFKNEESSKIADEKYWKFRLLSNGAEVEPYKITTQGNTGGALNVGSATAVIGSIRQYNVVFQNPNGAANPGNLKLTIEGGDVKRGFEWRFK